MSRSYPAVLFLLLGFLSAGCDSGPSDPGGELLVQDLVVGTGDEVRQLDTVVTQFVGRLEDGTVFFDTVAEGEPLIFTMGVFQVIRGFDQGLLGARVGGTRRLVIPPSLAFGKNGWCPSDHCLVPSYEVVTFDVTVESIMSDVIIEEVNLGTGALAENGDELSVEYIGTLLSGQIFDTTETYGVPFKFTLGAGAVIPGWETGVAGMRIGGWRKLTIPPHLAYGSSTVSGIPSFSVLVFEIRLVGITGK